MQIQSDVTESKSTKSKEDEVNAIDFLMSQHREVEELFTEIENAGDRAKKKKESLFATLAEKLTAHTKIEESIFYPAAKKADEDLVLEAFEEHANVKSMIRKLQKTGGNDETFDAKMTVLRELVKHHVKEEENQLFPKCRDVMGVEALDKLGIKMKLRFEALGKSH